MPIGHQNSVSARSTIEQPSSQVDQVKVEYEERIKNLTSKVDSLVKFLEEERTQRKEAEGRVQ